MTFDSIPDRDVSEPEVCVDHHQAGGEHRLRHLHGQDFKQLVRSLGGLHSQHQRYNFFYQSVPEGGNICPLVQVFFAKSVRIILVSPQAAQLSIHFLF